MRRAAALVAAGVAAIVSRILAGTKPNGQSSGDTLSVTVDGSVYVKYDRFRRRLHAELAAALAPLGATLVASSDSASNSPDRSNGAAGPAVRIAAHRGGSLLGSAVLAAAQAAAAQ